MDKDQIIEIIKYQISEVLPEIPSEALSGCPSMKLLGANSIDRAEVVVMTLEELDLAVPLIDLGGAQDICHLADLMLSHM